MATKRRNRLQCGSTLAEVIIAAGVNVMALAGVVLIIVAGMSSWMRGESRIEAESGAQDAMRTISQELKEAMSITVDANGQGLSYQLPSKDSGGNYVAPVTSDGVARRLQLTGTSIVKVSGTQQRTLATGVATIDPLTNQAYQIFTPGAGSLTRQVTVQIVLSRNTVHSKTSISRNRETIFLRNVPQITR